MKNSILFFTLILTVFTNSLLAEVHAPQKIVNRTKTGCFPGCNSVTRTETPGTYTRSDGKVIDVIIVNIDCSGTAFSSCPSQIAAPPASYPDPFTETCGNLLFDYAINQISLNVTSGNYSQNYFNTSTGETWQFSAVWTTVGGVETIDVYMEFLY